MTHNDEWYVNIDLPVSLCNELCSKPLAECMNCGQCRQQN
jgi:hypothetical protein